jgi:uncharacterized protein (TIRG00374 family)
VAQGARRLKWAIPLILAGWLLYFSFRGVEWARIWSVISEADRGMLALACLVGGASYLMRAIRWRILLSADRRIELRPVFNATMAGYLGNNFLPARSGELVRSGMITAQTGIPVSRVLATALIERLVDALLLLSWTPFVLANLAAAPPWMSHAAVLSGAVAIAGALVVIILPLLQKTLLSWLKRFHLSPKWEEKAANLLSHTLDGLRSLHDAGRILRFLACSAVIWSIDAVNLVMIARALGIPAGFRAALLLLTGLGLGSALPSTPGYVGIYQFVAVSALAPFGISRTDALGYILVVQGLSYLVITALGLVAIWDYRRFLSAKT